MKKKSILILSLFFIFLVLSCKKENTSELNLSLRDSYITDTTKSIKKLNIVYNNDSIIISRLYEKKEIKTSYIKKDNQIWTILKQDPIKQNFDTIIFMTLVDTSFIWSKNDISYPFIIGFNNTNSFYEIKKITENKYCTIINSLIDNLYSEKYLYDSTFQILRFEYTYNANRYVYLPSKK